MLRPATDSRRRRRRFVVFGAISALLLLAVVVGLLALQSPPGSNGFQRPITGRMVIDLRGMRHVIDSRMLAVQASNAPATGEWVISVDLPSGWWRRLDAGEPVPAEAPADAQAFLSSSRSSGPAQRNQFDAYCGDWTEPMIASMDVYPDGIEGAPLPSSIEELMMKREVQLSDGELNFFVAITGPVQTERVPSGLGPVAEFEYSTLLLGESGRDREYWFLTPAGPVRILAQIPPRATPACFDSLTPIFESLRFQTPHDGQSLVSRNGQPPVTRGGRVHSASSSSATAAPVSRRLFWTTACSSAQSISTGSIRPSATSWSSASKKSRSSRESGRDRSRRAHTIRA